MKIDKPILAWNIDDLELLRDDPYNLEDMNIEYKQEYNQDADELRKDIVSFANSELIGYILLGIKDDPFDLIGIPRKEVDKLQITIDEIINAKIDPKIDPPPILNPIYLGNDLYVLGMQIFPKMKGLYAIRKSNNPNDPNFQCYSFWIRSEGRKRQLSMEEVNNNIIKTDPYKKFLEVKVELGLVGKPGNIEECISVHGVNKSMRPIIIRSYGFHILDKKDEKWLGLWLPQPDPRYPSTILNTIPNTKLLDGESCSGFYLLSNFREDMSKHGITFPTKIKGVINTTDGPFYSNERELTLDMISRN